MTIRQFSIIAAASVIVAFAAGFGVAASLSRDSSGLAHGNHSGSGPMPKQAGQGAFAAMAEIVSLLERDEATDWSLVNIDALRKHLQDMNALTLGAEAKAELSEKVVRFVVTGDKAVARALQNMVPAHARELDNMSEWSAVGVATEGGATLTITAKNEAALARIKGLGFFGLMATGAHHQAHHLAMASGARAH